MSENLPPAAFTKAFGPGTIAYPDVEPLTGRPVQRLNIYWGEVTLLDYFAAQVLAGVGSNLSLLCSDASLVELAHNSWRLAEAMLRTRPVPPKAANKNGGGP